MNKKLEKHETFISISLIIIYLILNSICLNNFGLTNINTFFINLILTISIIVFIIKNKLTNYYGLSTFPNPKKYLFFIPLLLLISVNYLSGINIVYSTKEILSYILSMFLIGFLEEIIFRGFLFKMMAKDNIKTAIIVTSITFGIGHILNLFNGAELIPTLIQITYAIFTGYLFVTIFHKSNSLWPCIITHSLVNASSVFYVATNITEIICPLILIIVSLTYTIYINKTIK